MRSMDFPCYGSRDVINGAEGSIRGYDRLHAHIWAMKNDTITRQKEIDKNLESSYTEMIC